MKLWFIWARKKTATNWPFYQLFFSSLHAV